MDTLPRERPEPTREGLTRRLCVPGRKAFVRANRYPDGRLCELFITIAGQSATDEAAWADIALTWGSLAMQHGVKVETLVRRLRGVHTDHGGFTGDKEFPSASSLHDLVAQWLIKSFLMDVEGNSLPPPPPAVADAMDEVM